MWLSCLSYFSQYHDHIKSKKQTYTLQSATEHIPQHHIHVLLLPNVYWFTYVSLTASIISGGVLMKSKRDQDVHVHCPKCSFPRLFDCTTSSEGTIKIKCPGCKSILDIDLHEVLLNYGKKRMKGYRRVADNNITEPRISMET